MRYSDRKQRRRIYGRNSIDALIGYGVVHFGIQTAEFERLLREYAQIRVRRRAGNIAHNVRFVLILDIVADIAKYARRSSFVRTHHNDGRSFHILLDGRRIVHDGYIKRDKHAAYLVARNCVRRSVGYTQERPRRKRARGIRCDNAQPRSVPIIFAERLDRGDFAFFIGIVAGLTGRSVVPINLLQLVSKILVRINLYGGRFGHARKHIRIGVRGHGRNILVDHKVVNIDIERLAESDARVNGIIALGIAQEGIAYARVLVELGNFGARARLAVLHRQANNGARLLIHSVNALQNYGEADRRSISAVDKFINSAIDGNRERALFLIYVNRKRARLALGRRPIERGVVLNRLGEHGFISVIRNRFDCDYIARVRIGKQRAERIFGVVNFKRYAVAFRARSKPVYVFDFRFRKIGVGNGVGRGILYFQLEQRPGGQHCVFARIRPRTQILLDLDVQQDILVIERGGFGRKHNRGPVGGKLEIDILAYFGNARRRAARRKQVVAVIRYSADKIVAVIAVVIGVKPKRFCRRVQFEHGS